MSTDIAIIGGGISGITTAVTLEQLGYETKIYTTYLVNERAPDNPMYASSFPAASIIPHSVQTRKLATFLPPSQKIFRYLLAINMPHIKLHRHYELFEFPREDPPYARFLKKFERIEDNDLLDTQIPMRPGASQLHGWAFNCMIAEWPGYIQRLYQWYKILGGKIVIRHITMNDLRSMEARVIVNCTGIWSKELFADDKKRNVIRGHLLKIPGASIIKDNKGMIPSYNYTPGSNIYADPQGKATDIYFYPRSDCWILGGSRQKGVVDESGHWEGAANSDNLEIDGMELPKQIYTLNRDILAHTYNRGLEDYKDITAQCGYRYIRSDQEEGLRLETAWENGQLVVHNYGHGGAGVTLSWGCALEVARQLEKNNNGHYVQNRPDCDRELLGGLQQILIDHSS